MLLNGYCDGRGCFRATRYLLEETEDLPVAAPSVTQKRKLTTTTDDVRQLASSTDENAMPVTADKPRPAKISKLASTANKKTKTTSKIRELLRFKFDCPQVQIASFAGSPFRGCHVLEGGDDPDRNERVDKDSAEQGAGGREGLHWVAGALPVAELNAVDAAEKPRVRGDDKAVPAICGQRGLLGLLE